MDSFKKATLGQIGIKVGRLGVAASYGAPADAFEEAFDSGCNYFYWGSQRRSGMRQTILNICQKGNRDDLIIVVQSYSRSAFLMEAFLKKALRSLDLGPLNENELKRVRKIGDWVHEHSGKFF